MVLLCQNNERWCMIQLILLIQIPQIILSCSTLNVNKLSPLDRELKTFIDKILKTDNYKILPGVSVKRDENVSFERLNSKNCKRNDKNINDYFKEKLFKYALSHYVNVNVPQTARLFKSFEFGKSSFMAGFGMGFLAKLLLPVFVGAQIIKSILLALFLPSIVGNLGKLLGKGLSSFSGNSGASGLGQTNDQMEDFEFKDTSPYNTEGETQDSYEAGNNIRLNVAGTEKPEAANRFGFGNNRIYNTLPIHSDNYYFRKPIVKTDFKTFHKIPPSSLLLTTYDPFYSPLLSRLDVVFQQLGLGNDKSAAAERCRERLVCMMYANPAKYAPYSNLVSAQLSRELNELRRPSSDNPEILRFFRYMKAAKDGQDGEECLLHGGCPSLMANRPSPAMLTTYNDINKLVHARKLY